MAIDTEDKRRSIARVLPVADSSIGQSDRQQIAWIYSAVLSGLTFIGVKNYSLKNRELNNSPEIRIQNFTLENRITQGLYKPTGQFDRVVFNVARFG